MGLAVLALTQGLTGCVHPSAQRGRRALDEQAFQAAAGALEDAVSARPEEISYWLDLGRAYVGLGKGAEAVRAFERATLLSPREARLAIYLGHAHELSRAYDRAEAAYRAAMALEPTRAFPYRVLGTRLLRWGRAEEAIPLFQDALQRDFAHAETHHALAIAFAHSGQPQQAEQTLRTALKRFPKERSLRLGLAALVVNRAGYEEALALYGEVLRDAPDFAPAYVGRGLLLLQLGQKAEAERELLRAVALDPKNAAYLERLRRAN